MDIRNICPAAVSGLLSRVSRTQPVPSIAACFAGSARTAKMASAGALMTVVALRLSSAMWLPPHWLNLSRFRRSPSPELTGRVDQACFGEALGAQAAGVAPAAQPVAAEVAGPRQLERRAHLDAQADDVRFAQVDEPRADVDRTSFDATLQRQRRR